MGRLKRYYNGNKKLKAAGVKIAFTQEQSDELDLCSSDPVYFIKTYMKIITTDHGQQPFAMWPFQEDMVKDIIENRFVIAKMPRQVGKTTVVAGILLWYILFNETFKISILAHKDKQAQNILSRLKYAYELLPHWLQQGVIEWNKTSIKLENESIIDTNATASSGVRGDTYNIVYLDEFCHVENHVQEEFFASTYPVITSGTTTKIIITSTPKGMDLFYRLWTESEEERNSYKRVSVHWSQVPGRTQEWADETIRNTSQRQFDQEFGCEFLGSTSTLISGAKLKSLTWKAPLMAFENKHLAIYEPWIHEHNYILVADTSEGIENDYHAFCVFDITEVPYKVVARYRDNELSHLLLPSVIHRAARAYGDCAVLIEIASSGQQVSDILYYDLEYENVLVTQVRGRGGVKLGGTGVGKPMRGVKTTKQVKSIGCSNLKSLIESDKLLFWDEDLFGELCRFVETRGSYKAEEGYHDDVVMCCVLFAWMINHEYFKGLTDTNARENLASENKTRIEDNLTPFLRNDNIPEDPIQVINTLAEFYNLDIHPMQESDEGTQWVF